MNATLEAVNMYDESGNYCSLYVGHPPAFRADPPSLEFPSTAVLMAMMTGRQRVGLSCCMELCGDGEFSRLIITVLAMIETEIGAPGHATLSPTYIFTLEWPQVPTPARGE